jgi:molecular chaperone DnaK (HSP70)
MKKENGRSDCWNPMNQEYCNGNQKFKIFNKIFSTRKLIGIFLDELMRMVPSDIFKKKESLNRVGVSVPAIFGYTPRHTIFDLVLEKFDGNAKINIINEPTAAIIACQDEMLEDNDGIYAILDIGGGTTDIVLYEKREEAYFLFKPSGIKIAGDDLDIALNKALNQGSDITYEAQREIRRAKERLSVLNEVTVFGRKLTRKDYMQIVKPEIVKIISELGKEIKKVFDFYKPSSMTGKKFRLNTIYLSGGGARIPFLGDLIKQDNQISVYDPDINIIKNKRLHKIYEDGLSIVVVALGTSRLKGKISDCVQFILPYSIRQVIGDQMVEKLSIYTELPARFNISKKSNEEFKIIACDPNDPDKPVHDLTTELISDTDEIELDKFVNRSNYYEVKINKFNIMRVEATALPSHPFRPFPLPWQGGIENTLFDKYREQWRTSHSEQLHTSKKYS